VGVGGIPETSGIGEAVNEQRRNEARQMVVAEQAAVAPGGRGQRLQVVAREVAPASDLDGMRMIRRKRIYKF
jgi:hypothetical protein